MASSMVAMATPLQIPEAGLAGVDMKGISNLVENWLGEDYKPSFGFYTVEEKSGSQHIVPQFKFESADGLRNVRVHGGHYWVPEWNEENYVLRIGEQVEPTVPGAIKNPFGNDFWRYYDSMMNVVTGNTREDMLRMHIPTNTNSFMTVFNGLRDLFK